MITNQIVTKAHVVHIVAENMYCFNPASLFVSHVFRTICGNLVYPGMKAYVMLMFSLWLFSALGE